MKYYFVYLTTNLINNKRYIGKRLTYIIEDGYLGSGTHLRNSIKKYGKENFKREILEFCSTNKELNDKEKYWIKFFNAVEDKSFYNLRDGGDGGKLSKESIEKMKKTKKENPYSFSEEQRRNFSKFHKTRKRSKETYLKISIANTGKIRSEETKKKDSLIKKEYYKNNPSKNKGLKLSEKSKKEISITVKKIWENPFMREKYSNAAKNRIKVECPWCHRIIDKSTSQYYHFENCYDNPNNNKQRKILKYKYEKIECPHCGKIGGGSSMKRYHFDNCKFF